ncbi:mCG148379 [Mus musculus]|nr:mCG148379 [Mus musculus]
MKDPRGETLPQTLKSRDSRVPKKTLRPYIKCRRCCIQQTSLDQVPSPQTRQGFGRLV